MHILVPGISVPYFKQLVLAAGRYQQEAGAQQLTQHKSHERYSAEGRQRTHKQHTRKQAQSRQHRSCTWYIHMFTVNTIKHTQQSYIYIYILPQNVYQNKGTNRTHIDIIIGRKQNGHIFTRIIVRTKTKNEDERNRTKTNKTRYIQHTIYDTKERGGGAFSRENPRDIIDVTLLLPVMTSSRHHTKQQQQRETSTPLQSVRRLAKHADGQSTCRHI